MPLLARSVAELAATPSMRSAMEWFRRERAWINEQHLKLCRVPAPTFFEQKRAQWMAERFRSLGWDARIDRAGNVIASLPGSSAGTRDRPAVAVTAHLDTVLAPRVPEEIKVTGDGCLLGPGVSDNGAGLAALLALAAVWQAGPPVSSGSPVVPNDGVPLVPLLIANVGEEGEGNLSGMRYLCRKAAGARSAGEPRIGDLRAFLVLDGPSVDHITWQALASRRFDILFTGPGGHSWSDYGTGNPVHALSRAVTLFADQVPVLTNGVAQALACGPPSPDMYSNGTGPLKTGNLPRSSFNFGVIQGGASINSIPSEARAKVDLRSESTERLEEMAALLASSVERAVELENARSDGRNDGRTLGRAAERSAGRAGHAAGGRAAERSIGHVAGRMKEIGSRPGGGLQEGAPLLECIRAVDAHLGIRSYLDCSSTDANVPLSLGLPAVSIGAGGQGGGAHTPAEWFKPERRELGLQRVLLALCMLLGGE
jgi:tripeptide aminopeptidase